jgi:hypothetical protein
MYSGLEGEVVLAPTANYVEVKLKTKGKPIQKTLSTKLLKAIN